MSSRIDHQRGCVVITAPGGESGYEVGRTFWPVGEAPIPELALYALNLLHEPEPLRTLDEEPNPKDGSPCPERPLGEQTQAA